MIYARLWGTIFDRCEMDEFCLVSGRRGQVCDFGGERCTVGVGMGYAIGIEEGLFLGFGDGLAFVEGSN